MLNSIIHKAMCSVGAHSFTPWVPVERHPEPKLGPHATAYERLVHASWYISTLKRSRTCIYCNKKEVRNMLHMRGD